MVRKHQSEFQKPVSGSAKEPSGAQKRKRKQEVQEDTKKLQAQAAKHFKVIPEESAGPLHHEEVEGHSAEHGLIRADEGSSSVASDELSSSIPAESNSLSVDPGANVDQPSPPQNAEEDTNRDANSLSTLSHEIDTPNESIGGNGEPHPECCLDSNPDESVDVNDPSTWPLHMPAPLKRRILTSTAHYDMKEPGDSVRFWNNYRFGTKPNAERFERTWIRVSKTTNSASCLACCFFSPHQTTKSVWSTYGSSSSGSGFQDFHNGLRGVLRHEESKAHLDSMTSWKMFVLASEDPSSLSSQTARNMNQNISEWRLILRGIVDAVLFLAQNNLAFQGPSHDIRDPNCGNFLNLIKLLSKYYAPLSKHVARLRKGSVSYLSPEIQNDFISLCGKRIRSEIITNVQARKYFSIMLDSTPDTSHMEQVSQIVRSVECTGHGCSIHENFLDFVSTTAKTGAGLTDMILQKLKTDGLDVANCRGQGYDNGSNMAGYNLGVQALIQKTNPVAKFVPCAAHSLNRVGVNAAEKVLSAKLILGVVQNIYTFFVASPARWETLKTKLKITLKGHSQTRWSSKSDAVGALWKNFEKVLEILSDMSESDKFKSDINAAAQSRLMDIMNFKFMIGLVVWNQILFQINLCNVNLQNKDTDVSIAEKKLGVLCQWLTDFQETGFERCRKIAEVEAARLNISMESGFSNIRLGRGINSKYDDPVKVASVKSLSNLERFEKDFFDKLLSTLVQEMSSRFTQIKSLVDDFGFLWGNGLQTEFDRQQDYVKNICKKYPNDFNEDAFCNEIQALPITVNTFLDGRAISCKQGPLDILNIIYTNGLEGSYPNCEIALRIFLTLPVTVASNERAFSKLKIIKNYLRSRMSQERLSGLSIISIERAIASQLDFDKIINEFAAEKCRKISII